MNIILLLNILTIIALLVAIYYLIKTNIYLNKLSKLYKEREK